MTKVYDPEQHGELLLIPEARQHLFAQHKITLSPQRLADLRSTGGGPEFIKPSQREVRYPRALLDTWAEKRNAKPILAFVPVKTVKWNARPKKPQIMFKTSEATDGTIGQENTLNKIQHPVRQAAPEKRTA